MKYGLKLNVKVSAELHRRLTKAARQLRVTRSQMVRDTLEHAVSLHEKYFKESERTLYYIRLKPSQVQTLVRKGYDLKPDLTDVVEAEEIQGFEECIAAIEAGIARAAALEEDEACPS